MSETELIEEFCGSFFGYGNLDASLWFVGMEEGGGQSRDEVCMRLESWNASRSAVVDIVDFGVHAGLDEHLQWFETDKPPLQSTWKQLIRIAFAMRGERITNDAIRQYQRDMFARKSGNECLLELFPLPSPGVGEWRYNDWFEMEWLKDRDTYRQHLLGLRIEGLKNLIQTHRPSVVVFYSKSYVNVWSQIVGVDVAEFSEWTVTSSDERVLTALRYLRDETTFIVTNHPTAFGTTNTYFAEIGGSLRKMGASKNV